MDQLIKSQLLYQLSYRGFIYFVCLQITRRRCVLTWPEV